MKSFPENKNEKTISEKLHNLNNSVTLLSGNLPFLKEAWYEIKPILENLQTKNEIARIPINDFFKEYENALEEMEIGCKKIMQTIKEIKSNNDYEKNQSHCN